MDGGDSGRKWLVEVERDEWCRRRVKPATDCVVQVRGDRSTSFDDADLHSPASEVVDQGGKDAVARSNYDSLETADEEIRIGNGEQTAVRTVLAASDEHPVAGADRATASLPRWSTTSEAGE